MENPELLDRRAGLYRVLLPPDKLNPLVRPLTSSQPISDAVGGRRCYSTSPLLNGRQPCLNHEAGTALLEEPWNTMLQRRMASFTPPRGGGGTTRLEGPAELQSFYWSLALGRGGRTRPARRKIPPCRDSTTERSRPCWSGAARRARLCPKALTSESPADPWPSPLRVCPLLHLSRLLHVTVVRLLELKRRCLFTSPHETGGRAHCFGSSH